jgi:hypothetical protein
MLTTFAVVLCVRYTATCFPYHFVVNRYMNQGSVGYEAPPLHPNGCKETGAAYIQTGSGAHPISTIRLGEVHQSWMLGIPLEFIPDTIMCWPLQETAE